MAAQVMGNYFRAAGIRLFAVGLHSSRRRDCAACRHCQPDPGRALLARTRPYRKASSPRLVGSDDAAVVTVVGEIGDVKQLAADVPTANQIYCRRASSKLALAPLAPVTCGLARRLHRMSGQLPRGNG